MSEERPNNIVVVGSINMDLVIDMHQFPVQGETVFGKSFTTTPGGKGANQAIAAARLGGFVHIVGAVGKDAFGRALTHNFVDNNVDVAGLTTVSTATGIALIQLHEGDNRITVVSGANYDVTEAMLAPHICLLAQAALVVLQLELPVNVTEYVLRYCQAHSIPVLLNPAPATNFQPHWLDAVTYITPNETECAAIFQMTPQQAVRQHEGKVIVTCGKDGAMFAQRGDVKHVQAPIVRAVDTTGAGDTFNGALAVAIVEGKSLQQAVEFAVQAASKSVQKLGAQGGMPRRHEL